MKKSILLKLTSAIVMDGEIITSGELIEVTEKEAKNLLHRGKAELATNEDVKDVEQSENESSENLETNQDETTDEDVKDDLTEKTVKELKELAEEAGVEGFSRMNKGQLISALTAGAE